jgi:hypothetical protein
MRIPKDRLARLERESATLRSTSRCSHCRDWPSVYAKQIDVDGTETWETEEPRECPLCDRAVDLVTFHVVADWASVTVPSRGR